MQKTIIYFQQNATWGSAEEYLVLLIEGLDKKIYRPVLVCPRDKTVDPLVNSVRSFSDIYRYRGKGFGLLYKLVNIFRQQKPDIIHVNDPGLMGILAAHFICGKKLVLTYHTPELNIKYNWKGRIAWRLAFARPIQFIVLSEKNKEILSKKYNFKKKYMSVINPGLKKEKFKEIFDKQKTKNEFRISPDKFVLINASRLCDQKNHRILIDAIENLTQSIQEKICVLIVGEGENEHILKEMVTKKKLENIFIFTGYRTDIPKLLSASDIFVLSSYYEGFPFAIMEAMASSKPVIATDVGGVSDLVINGKTGIIIPSGNRQALADAIIYAFNNPEQISKMGLAGRERFEKFFTENKMVAKTQAFYESLLK